MQDTPERFAALHAECHDGVYRYLHRRIAPAHLAEDLCDETFRIAWERLLSGKTVDMPYLVGIARNLLRNTYRAHVKRRDLESLLLDDQRQAGNHSGHESSRGFRIDESRSIGPGLHCGQRIRGNTHHGIPRRGARRPEICR